MIKIKPNYYGRSKPYNDKSDYFGKKTTNAFYCHSNNISFFKDQIGKAVLLPGRKVPIKISGVYKNTLPTGFFGIKCVEICYVSIKK